MVTAYARAMVLEWGMSERLGFVNYAGQDSREMFIPERDYSPETARIIDEEIRRLADEAYADAVQLVGANWEKVEAIADALLRHETLQRDEVEKLMRGERLEKSTVAEILQKELPKPPSPAPSAGTSGSGGEDLGGLVPRPA